VALKRRVDVVVYVANLHCSRHTYMLSCNLAWDAKVSWKFGTELRMSVRAGSPRLGNSQDSSSIAGAELSLIVRRPWLPQVAQWVAVRVEWSLSTRGQNSGFNRCPLTTTRTRFGGFSVAGVAE
jgi:hypothetical protein